MPEVALDVLDRTEHLLDADQREVIAGHGDDDFIGVGQRVLVEEVQRWAAVDDDDSDNAFVPASAFHVQFWL